MFPGFVFGIDPIIFSVLALILLFIFFVFLLLRRTAQEFRDGVDRSRK